MSWSQEKIKGEGRGAIRNLIPWVIWGTGECFYNIYPDSIIELYERNATLRAVTDRNKSAILGDELNIDNDTPQTVAGILITPTEYLDLIGLDAAAREAIAADISLWNGAAIQVGFAPETRIPNGVKQVKFYKIRTGVPDSEGNINCSYICQEWSLVGKSNKLPLKGYTRDARQFNTPRRIASLGQGEELELMVFKQYSPISEYYPMPDCESCREALKVSNDIIDFQLGYINNGMNASGVMYIPYTPRSTPPGDPQLSQADQDQINQLKKHVGDQLAGTKNAGKILIVTYNPQATDANGNPIGLPKIEAAPSDRNDQKFLEIQKESRQSILTGLNVVSPELFGIPNPGGFTSQSEMLLTANEIHYNLIIKPKQQLYLKFVNEILKMAGFEATASVTNSLPITYKITPEMVTAGIFTIDEFREQFGYQPIGGDATAIPS